ncbi:MAG TPA: rhodanese-like domain-containing protein [Terriglobales bacterium]|nr:rhodanese-like domain-containing protein [Terriglobales bacterium]
MRTILRILLFITLCFSFANLAFADEGVNGNLVTVKWLEKNLNRPDLVLLDASLAPAYAKEHIPGAINFDLFTYGVQTPPLSVIEKRYQSWGISPGKKIVIYDQGGSYLATRLFFSFDYHGFPTKDIFVLDGGLSKWKEAGLQVTKDVPSPPKPGTFKIEINKNVRVDLPEFLTASGDPVNNALVEALDPDWHYGGISFFARPGHPPNSIMLPSGDFFNPDKTFKSADEIRKMVTYLGIKPEQQIHSFCGGGIAASVPYFAIKYMLNYPKVKLFPGSELEWLSDPRDLPFFTYDFPLMLRDSQWLQFWNGQRARMYGISDVSVIDVRQAEAFNQGHLPFALNIPADVFRTSLNNPSKLAEILGPAGINASHEAVLISGAGLTPDSALAFVALETLGQKKTSVFIDSMDKWTQKGQQLTKDATVVGPRQPTQPLAIPPATYPVKLRDGILIKDARSTQGVFPKVFIASGKTLPTKQQEGKIVHVPYTDLLNADGTPKAANDIWNVLMKAGVPRYAELVCVADDPGEAAVNYFILKLMGFPDIKMMI